MTNNKDINNNELNEVVGGATPGAKTTYEFSKACDSFICIKCGGEANKHVIKSNGNGSTSVYSIQADGFNEEWEHYMLDCNHCKYFNRILYATGECTKDC